MTSMVSKSAGQPVRFEMNCVEEALYALVSMRQLIDTFPSFTMYELVLIVPVFHTELAIKYVAGL